MDVGVRGVATVIDRFSDTGSCSSTSALAVCVVVLSFGAA